MNRGGIDSGELPATEQRRLLAKATRALHEGDLQEAASLCQRILADRPDFAAAHHLLGLIAIKDCDTAAARAAFVRAVECAPENVEYLDALANIHLLTGDRSAAQDIWTRLRNAAPDGGRACYGLGRLALTEKRFAEAEGFLRAAVDADPENAGYWVAYGDSLARREKWREAMAALGRGYELAPTEPRTANLLGQVRMQMKDWLRAAENFDQVIEARPDDFGSRYRLAICRRHLGQLDEAARHIEAVLTVDQRHGDAWRELSTIRNELGDHKGAIAALREATFRLPGVAELWTLLGANLQKAEEFETAADAYRQAVEIDPAKAAYHYNLGVVLALLGRKEAASAAYEKALACDPDFAQAHYNLGLLLYGCRDNEGALNHFERAAAADPSNVTFCYQYAQILRNVGRFEDAIMESDRILACQPDHALAHFNKGLALLHLGRLSEGWPEYDWRDRDPAISGPAGFHSFRAPRWRGEQLDGETVLVFCEQGYGDAIQFVRYAPMIRARGGRVLLECRKPLADLLARADGVDDIVIWQRDVDPEVPYDLHIPIMSLPGAFGTTMETIPCAAPYLSPDPRRVAYWRDALAGRGLKVGLSWSGNPKNPENIRRACRPGDMAPLAVADDVRFYSLQLGTPRQWMNEAPAELDLVDLAPHMTDFLESAAIYEALDLVITTCSAPAHLAGALARPCWVALQSIPDWRWFVDRADSPWYPTLRLFRQSRAWDWTLVFDQMAHALRDFAAQSRGRR